MGRSGTASAPTTAMSPAVALRPAWRVALVPFLVSRVVSDALIGGMCLLAGQPVMTEGFARWDGGWYLAIAKVWYPADPTMPFHFGDYTSWPFFPLLPSILRVADWLMLPPAEAGIVVNHVAFFVALVGLARLARRHMSSRAERITLWTLALFPFSFVFSMLYPSSILLAGSVWAFCLVEERRDWWAGGAVLVATMVRPNGFVIALAIAVGLRHELRRLVPVCGPAAVALAGWMLYNYQRAGDPLTFYKAKAGWEEITLYELVYDFRPVVTTHLLLAVVAMGFVVWGARWMPRSWVALAALYLLPSMLLGIHGLGRYSNECFPPFVAAGRFLERRPTRFVVALLATWTFTQALLVYVVVVRVPGAAP